MERLIKIIQNYESDTFSASSEEVTEEEAKQVAERLLDRLCKVVEVGGALICDGEVLSEILEDVRFNLVTCPTCKGEGGCVACKGSGWVVGTIGDEDRAYGCGTCDGNGFCVTCKGEGKIEFES